MRAELEPPDKPAAPGRPKVGEVNVLIASIGARGAGKSTGQVEEARALTRRFGGAYVVGHSLGQRLPTKFLDGTPTPIVYHQTIAQLDRGLRRRPGSWHILAPSSEEHGGPKAAARESADDLIGYVRRLSAAVLAGAYREAHPVRAMFGKVGRTLELPSTPIVLIIDEGIAVDGASVGRRRDQAWFLEFLYSLRHEHIALLYSIQDPTARSWRVLEQASVIRIYQLRHEWAVQAIRAAGANADELERIRALKRFEFVELSGEAVDDPAARMTTPKPAAEPDADDAQGAEPEPDKAGDA